MAKGQNSKKAKGNRVFTQRSEGAKMQKGKRKKDFHAKSQSSKKAKGNRVFTQRSKGAKKQKGNWQKGKMK